jgi:hypothetical protein
LTLLGVSLGAPVIHAAPRLFVDLRYEADANLTGCPGDSDFRALITGQLGYAPFRSDAEQTVVARALGGVRGVEGFVEWRDAAGNVHGLRKLDSDGGDCAALARAMSFAIAVQIQLLAEEEAAASTAAKKPVEAPESAPSAQPAPSPKRIRHEVGTGDTGRANGRGARTELMIGGGMALGFWIAPRTAVEGRVFAGALRGPFALELAAEASLRDRYVTSPARGFEQQVILGSVAACGVLRPLLGCVVNKWGRLAVRGFGVDVPRSSSGLIAQVGPRVMLSEHLGSRFAGALRVEALATLAPWRVTLNEREVWKTPLVSVSLGADFAALFRDNP